MFISLIDLNVCPFVDISSNRDIVRKYKPIAEYYTDYEIILVQM